MASSSLGEVSRLDSRSRVLSRSLSGYLCGTHSGLLDRRRGDRPRIGELATEHRAMEPAEPVETLDLGSRWKPPTAATALAGQLRALLDHRPVADLVVFGSQATDATTGFSDLDAVLVIHDRAAEDSATLRALRPRILAAQRAVLAHQPMQHHGFEAATPKLLAHADVALDLPRESLTTARSLLGRPLDVGFSAGRGLDPAGRLSAMVRQLSALSAWPAHPWLLHGTVSMFELLPALYLQSNGQATTKAASFDLARVHFQDGWWPYEVLERVRAAWPRVRNRRLELGAAAARNPWVAVRAWSRLPSPTPGAVQPLLSSACLSGLQDLARRMLEATR